MEGTDMTPVVIGATGTDWTQVAGAIGVFTLLTTVISVIIWQIATTRRAKVLLVREQEYRRIAEEGVATQQNTEHQLKDLGERLVEMQSRMASIERILQQVE